MRRHKVCDIPVSKIMRQWPGTVRVFIDLHLHCIGCPIGDFHTLSDAAIEHGLSAEDLCHELSAVLAEIARAGRGGDGRRHRS
jgi:hybrid cluster-associated redox disulfide protein